MQALMKSLNELCDALPFQTSFYEGSEDRGPG
jgi:hypothetical protein